MADIIRVENVRKVYRLGRVEVPALRGVSVSVQEGEFVSIVGPSGCGKSTLLYIIGGLTRPSSGSVMVDGEEMGQMKDAQRTAVRRKKIGFIFQRFNLLPTLSAFGNIALAAEIASVKNGAIRSNLDSLVKLLGLEHRLKHHPGELSGGEQRPT